MQTISYEYERLRRTNDQTSLAGRAKQNVKRNRYCDVLPFDKNRVRLEDGPNDYINASLMTNRVNETPSWQYIACQVSEKSAIFTSHFDVKIGLQFHLTIGYNYWIYSDVTRCRNVFDGHLIVPATGPRCWHSLAAIKARSLKHNFILWILSWQHTTTMDQTLAMGNDYFVNDVALKYLLSSIAHHLPETHQRCKPVYF